MARSVFSRVFTDVTEALDRRFRWHRLPVPLGLLTLVGLRTWTARSATCATLRLLLWINPRRKIAAT